MKQFSWDSEKNTQLRKERNVGFEEVLFQISVGDVLDIIDSPNRRKYPGQKAFVLEISDYVYYVPFNENEDEIILKTIIPSRKLRKEYKGN